ncbi:hypothetical protein EV567_3084 [Streptomyces sp. BK239]|nr:hypothetical protein EV567_3084 [Streptomyces sp. BK239]
MTTYAVGPFAVTSGAQVHRALPNPQGRGLGFVGCQAEATERNPPK